MVSWQRVRGAGSKDPAEAGPCVEKGCGRVHVWLVKIGDFRLFKPAAVPARTIDIVAKDEV